MRWGEFVREGLAAAVALCQPMHMLEVLLDVRPLACSCVTDGAEELRRPVCASVHVEAALGTKNFVADFTDVASSSYLIFVLLKPSFQKCRYFRFVQHV